ncbi:DNA-binding anti-repressor SinI [Halobacillus amylolyticus]|uniref:Anti-repressor SinI family protein n=1 Tax=Halobacillus amylolyticus TaxID=2932259 RepID=A0ABY4HB34_9BACI|nr:DNA-binding anti-repressor SinI [Halobacillus amylolyticus]UOR11637.1 anti-repressor SinI family protein [Halobacillus amylolyticus]
MAETKVHEQLDHEWIKLMEEAKHLGLSIEEVKHFILGERA